MIYVCTVNSRWCNRMSQQWVNVPLNTRSTHFKGLPFIMSRESEYHPKQRGEAAERLEWFS